MVAVRELTADDRAAVLALERWAAARGLARIRLSTGAANAAPLGLYDVLGYQTEDVTLSKAVADQATSDAGLER